MWTHTHSVNYYLFCPKSSHQTLLCVCLCMHLSVQACVWLTGVYGELIAGILPLPPLYLFDPPISLSAFFHPLFFLFFCISSASLLVCPKLLARDCSKWYLGEHCRHSESAPDPGTSQPQPTSHAPRWYPCIKATNLPLFLCLPPLFSVSFSTVALPAASNV